MERGDGEREKGVRRRAAAGRAALRIVVGKVTHALPVGEVIALEAAGARPGKQVKKLDGEVTKIADRLGNARFMARAPEDIVDELRERRADAVSTVGRLRRAMAGLAG